MATTALKKNTSPTTNEERWLELYRQQQRLQTELAQTVREMRSLRGPIYDQLRTWGLSDEALYRALNGVY